MNSMLTILYLDANAASLRRPRTGRIAAPAERTARPR